MIFLGNLSRTCCLLRLRLVVISTIFPSTSSVIVANLSALLQESEITEMRQTIELLRKQSIQAGLTSAHMQSMGVQANGNGNGNGAKTNGSPTKAVNGQHEQNGSGNMQRQHSTDSMCSINSNGSNGSSQDKKKKKGWVSQGALRDSPATFTFFFPQLRSSFTKAFSRNAKITKTNRQTSLASHSDSKSSLPPPTPQKHQPPRSPSKSSPHRYIPIVENAKPVDSVEIEAIPIVEDLKKQLREKDMVLTDIRLEALTQASQMESLKETVRSMRQEMLNLKHNNERLQRMVTTRSLAGSEASLGCPASPSGSMGESRRYSLAPESGIPRAPLDLPQNLDETEEEDNCPPAPAPPAPLSPAIIADLSPTMERISISNEVLSTPAEDVADPIDGKKIEIAVFLGQSDAFPKYSDDLIDYDQCGTSETIIACTYISGKTTWQNLDYIVRKTFKDYLSRIDPGTNLGLNTDSITSYHLGEAKRGPEMGFPELLPCGYIIGNVKSLYICLQGVGSLAFDSLIPRSIVHRYINLLSEHRRLILCGPSGTGKSYLARKLAEFLVAKSNRSPAESIATFK
jgi:neuron navigator 2